MQNKLKIQNFSLTCLANRLIPWLVLSLIALGAGCGPQPLVQVDFQFPAGRKENLQKIEIHPTIKMGSNPPLAPYTALFNGKPLNQGRVWFNLPAGTNGKVDLSVLATLEGDDCPKYAAQTCDSTWLSIDEDRLYVIGMTFSEQTTCSSKSKGSAKNHQRD